MLLLFYNLSKIVFLVYFTPRFQGFHVCEERPRRLKARFTHERNIFEMWTHYYVISASFSRLNSLLCLFQSSCVHTQILPVFFNMEECPSACLKVLILCALYCAKNWWSCFGLYLGWIAWIQLWYSTLDGHASSSSWGKDSSNRTISWGVTSSHVGILSWASVFIALSWRSPVKCFT